MLNYFIMIMGGIMLICAVFDLGIESWGNGNSKFLLKRFGHQGFRIILGLEGLILLILSFSLPKF